MQSLIPNPLHPAVVHFPIVLAVLAPLVALGALWFMRRGARLRAAWGITVATLAALVVSAWVSLQTGEQQEERVEDVVSRQSLGAHEEAADLFLAMSAGALVVALAGFAPGRVGKVGRWLATGGTAAVLVAGWNVGHSGGMLVYRDGAASAYATAGAGAISDSAEVRAGFRSGEARSEREKPDDDERRRGDR